MDAIAERAGVTKQTLYYHFRTKDDLVASYLEARDEPTLARDEIWFDQRRRVRRGRIDMSCCGLCALGSEIGNQTFDLVGRHRCRQLQRNGRTAASGYANFCTLSKEKVRTGVLNRLSRSGSRGAGRAQRKRARSPAR